MPSICRSAFKLTESCNMFFWNKTLFIFDVRLRNRAARPLTSIDDSRGRSR